MERPDKPVADSRLIQLRTAELELSYLQQQQQQVIERLQRLRDFSEPPREAA